MRLLELFSGTGSVGRVFRARGWEVLSVDVDPEAGADVTVDVLSWDYSAFPRSYFDCVWASPPCTEYSIARSNARRPRNLELADAIVQRTIDIITYFGGAYWVENPATGLLAGRAVVRNLPEPYLVSYCMYGRPYRKNTYLWTNVPFQERPCDRECGAFVDGRHEATAQRGNRRGELGFSVQQLHAIPEGLVREVEAFTTSFLQSLGGV